MDVLFIDCLRMNTVERNKKRAAENKDIHILFSEGREHTVKGISFFRGGGFDMRFLKVYVYLFKYDLVGTGEIAVLHLQHQELEDIEPFRQLSGALH